MKYTILFSLKKGGKRNRKLKKLEMLSREECLRVIAEIGTHVPYISFCLISDDDVTHKAENIIYENRKMKSHRGL